MDEEQVWVELESAANFLRGLTLDPRLPGDIKEAISFKVAEIDEFLEAHE